MKELTDLAIELGFEPPTPKTTFNNTKWNYIARFIVDLQHEPDYHIMSREYVSLDGSLDNDCYFQECVANAELGHFLNTKFTGHLDIDMEPGIYCFVYGVAAKGESYETQDGTEYDAWEEYDLLSTYKYTEKEMKYISDETIPDEYQLETEQ